MFSRGRPSIVQVIALGCLAGRLTVGAQAPTSPALPSYPGLDAEITKFLYEEAGTTPPLDTIRFLSSLNSVRASRDYSRAAEYVASRAREAALDEVRIESFPTDGQRFYGTYRSEPGWNVRRAELWVRASASPSPETDTLLVDYDDTPLGLVWYSRSANVAAQLVDVGEGTRTEDYATKDVRGRIVLARGPHRLVHRLAVYERGAAGVLSSWGLFPDEFPDAHSSDGAGIRPWQDHDGRLSGFVFAISPRQAQALQTKLQSGRVDLRVDIDVEVAPSTYEIVSARVPGSGSRELILISHLDSTRPGACHNAAPAALLIEVGRVLTKWRALHRDSAAPAGVRLLWVPEHRGTMAWLLAHREIASNAIAAINLDLLADRQATTGSVLQLRQSPDSRPTYVNDVVADLLERVAEDNTDDFDRYPDRFSHPLLAAGGSVSSWRVLIAPFQGASDHVELNASGVPALSLGSWRYPYLGTTGDTADMFDPTHFRRLAFVVAASVYQVAFASPRERLEIADEVRARVMGRFAEAGAAARRVAHPSQGREQDRTAFARLTGRVQRERATIRTAWWWAPSPPALELQAVDRAGSEAVTEFRAALSPERRRTLDVQDEQNVSPTAGQVPSLDGNWMGPVTLDYLADRLASSPPTDAPALEFIGEHGDAAFESLNYVDGRRSIAEIALLVDGEFGPQRLSDYEAFFRALAACRIVSLNPMQK